MNMSPSYRWPERLLALVHRMPGPDPEALRGELWLLVRGALLVQLRREGPALAVKAPEVFEDLASEKALEMLLRIERGEWKVDSRSPGEVVAYLRRVARNALVDRLRRQGKEVTSMNEDLSASAEFQALHDPRAQAESRAVGRESADALRRCVEGLGAKARRVWYLRVFLGLASKEIARHPEVRLKASNVDVILQRTRKAVSDCMSKRGFEPGQMPTGSFSEMWLAMQEWEKQSLPEPEESGSASPGGRKAKGERT